MIYLRTFLKGFLIVALTSANVRQVANGHYPGVFLAGSTIGGVWWANSRAASRNDAAGAWLAYALGSGLGSVVGTWIGGHAW